jgi:hypothetical protein
MTVLCGKNMGFVSNNRYFSENFIDQFPKSDAKNYFPIFLEAFE